MCPAQPSPAGELNSEEPKEIASAEKPVVAPSSEAPSGPRVFIYQPRTQFIGAPQMLAFSMFTARMEIWE